MQAGTRTRTGDIVRRYVSLSVPGGIITTVNTTQVAAVMDEIRAEAGRKRVSIKELSRRIGIDYGTLRNYLAGRRVMDMAVMYRIADALGVSGGALLAAAEVHATHGPDGALAAHIRAMGGDQQDVTEALRTVTGDQGAPGGTVSEPEDTRGKRGRGRRAQ